MNHDQANSTNFSTLLLRRLKMVEETQQSPIMSMRNQSSNGSPMNNVIATAPIVHTPLNVTPASLPNSGDDLFANKLNHSSENVVFPVITSCPYYSHVMNMAKDDDSDSDRMSIVSDEEDYREDIRDKMVIDYTR